MKYVGDLLATMSQQVNPIKKRVWVTHMYELVLIESGRQDSNLRPSAPKALNRVSETLCFQAITKLLLDIALFD